MIIKKRIILFILSLALLLVPSALFAQNVVVSEDFQVSLPGIGRTFTILNTSDALNELVVNTAGNAFTITTNLSTGTVKVKSTEGVDIGRSNNTPLGLVLTSCDSGGSLLTVQANATLAVVVTITPPTVEPIICSAASITGTQQQSTGTGSAGSIGTPVGGTPSQITPPTPPTTPTTGEEPEPSPLPPGEPEIEFKDVPGKLRQADADVILQMAEYMFSQGTYTIPRNKKFYPKRRVNGDFAVRIALAIAGIPCTTNTSCKRAAIEAGFVPANFSSTKRVKRGPFYGILLKAISAELVDADVSDLKAACSDVRTADKKEEMAQVLLTAKGLDIAPASKRCRLHVTLSRVEAMRLAMKAVSAK